MGSLATASLAKGGGAGARKRAPAAHTTQKSGIESPLHHLARLCGIHTSFTDGLGNARTPPPETLLATVRALGHDVSSARAAGKAIEALKQEREERIIDPVIIAWDGRSLPVEVNLPGQRALEWKLELEGDSGEVLASQPGTKRTRAAAIRLPRHLPMGVHKLTVASGDVEAQTTVLAAPTRCYHGEDGEAGQHDARETGVFLPLYALSSKRSWGIGDLTDLDALTEWAGALGCNLIGTLPLLACYLDEPFDPSPYSPVTRLHFNEIFADLEAAPELKRSPAAQRLAGSERFKKELARLRQQKLVDYRAVYRAKRRVLDHMASAAFSSEQRRIEIESLLRSEPTLLDYARFRAAAERSGTTWQEWPKRQRSGQLRDGDYDEKSCRTHLYAQLLMREQLSEQSRLARERGGRLYLDLPLGAHGGGYDLWRFGDQFATELATGAPPDKMFTQGQNWGFPPLHPERSRSYGHQYFAAAIRNHLRFAGALRIDHIAGLHRIFAIPQGMPGEQGTYVDYPYEEFYAILSIESHRARAVIVGENLGNVPPQVTRAMHRRGLLGMWVGQFEIRTDRKKAIAPVARENLACLNTHDVHPFAAHWKGLDIPMRRDFGWLTDEEVRKEEAGRAAWCEAVLDYLRKRRHSARGRMDAVAVATALMQELSEGEAEILLVNLEDLWGEEEPQNIPGISEGYPNWRRKAARTLEEMTRDTKLAETVRRLARR